MAPLAAVLVAALLACGQATDVASALGEFPEAILHRTNALALEPGNVDVLALRAAAYLDSNEPEHTLVDLNRAIRTDPGNLFAYVLRGETRAALGQLDGAVADAEVVVGAADDLALQTSALWLRGTVRLILGDLDGGIGDLRRAAIDLAKSQLPDEPGLRLISGEYAARAGDVECSRS